MISLQDILPKLRGVKNKGNGGITCFCPAHNDQSERSLSIDEKDGKVLFYCFVGCDYKEIMKALDMSTGDVNSYSNGHIPAMTGKRTVYDIPLGDSDTVQHIRTDYPDGTKKFAWYRNGKLGLNGIKVSDLPLYGQWNVSPNDCVIICEGQKAQQALEKAGVVAVSTYGAEAIPSHDILVALISLTTDIVLWPDNDAPGRKQMNRIGKELVSLHTQPHIVNWLDVAKGDAADYVAAGLDVSVILATAQLFSVVAAPASAETSDTKAGIDNDIDLTDDGSAERLAGHADGTMKYSWPLGKWIFWRNDTWMVDPGGYAERAAIASTKQFYEETWNADTDYKSKSIRSAYALKGANVNRINATLELAKGVPSLNGHDIIWNGSPDLLGVRNGVVDLRNGTFRPERKEDYITKHAGASYDATAECPRFLQFLDEIFPDFPEMPLFLEQAIGYTLTGHMSEQRFFFCHGRGANGKSVLLTVLEALFGDYAATPGFSTFEKQTNGSPKSTHDLANLVDKRLILAAETNTNSKFDEARLKAWTGGEMIPARHMYQEDFFFRPVGKIWLAANAEPGVDDGSSAFWRRLVKIPFTRQFDMADPSTDKKLIQKLLAELPGILRWAIYGAMDWYAEGLNLPDSVKAESKEYEISSDILSDWKDQNCVLDKHASAAASVLYHNYLYYAESEGIKRPISQIAFSKLMAAKFAKAKNGKARLFKGIRLANE